MVDFEEIVNSQPVQPFWKIPAQRAEIPPGVRLRVFDNDGGREVASLAVTQPLIFGADPERAHVVERQGKGVGVYPEHVALLYTPKGFALHPVSGQSVLSALVHHRPLVVKLRGETSKLSADRAEHCSGLLDRMEKQTTRSTLFQPGDGRKKLSWQACVFSLGRSERIYFLDLVTRPELLEENKEEPAKKPKEEAEPGEKEEAKGNDEDTAAATRRSRSRSSRSPAVAAKPSSGEGEKAASDAVDGEAANASEPGHRASPAKEGGGDAAEPPKEAAAAELVDGKEKEKAAASPDKASKASPARASSRQRSEEAKKEKEKEREKEKEKEREKEKAGSSPAKADASRQRSSSRKKEKEQEKEKE